MAITLAERPRLTAEDFERIRPKPLPQEEIKKGVELLEEQAKVQDKTAADVISNLDLPIPTRAEIIQGFIEVSDGVISTKAMRFTLRMEEVPFNHHFRVFMERKLRGLTKVLPADSISKSA